MRSPRFPSWTQGDRSCSWLVSSHTLDEIPASTVAGLEELSQQLKGPIARIRAEQARREAVETLESLLAAAPLAIYSLDLEGKVTMWNAAAEKMFGWSESEVLGSLLPHVPEERGAGVSREARCGRRRRVTGAAGVSRRAAKGRLHYLHQGLPFPPARPPGSPGRPRMRERGHNREEAHGRGPPPSCSSRVPGGDGGGHRPRLQQPAHGGPRQCEPGPGRDRPGQAAKNSYRGVQRASEKAVSLTNQLLTFAKGGAPAKQLAVLNDLVADVVGFTLSGSPVRVDYLLTETWPVEVDLGQIGQVIQNLIINAKEAIPHEKGTIAVSTRDRTEGNGEEYVEIAVSNTGPPIPARIRERIFDPYFSTKKAGSGLGLAVAHSVVTRHGGKIEVESAKGSGTTFRVLLPARPGRERRQGRPRAARRSQRDLLAGARRRR